VAGVVHIPWYATGLRHDRLALALSDISAVSLRYGARSHVVYRMRDDRYKFLQVAEFEEKSDFERYWYGPEFTEFRVLCSSWYQVPVVYAWSDVVAAGSLEPETAQAPAGDEAPRVGGGQAA
jgi:hypothetical protein